MKAGRRPLALLVGALLVTAGLGFVPSPAAAEVTLGAGGEYHPVRPRTILDARRGSTVGPIHTRLTSSPLGTRISFDVTGVAGIPESARDVLAVVLHVSVRDPSRSGDLVAFASGQRDIPIASSLAFTRNRSSDGMVIARPGADGRVALAMRSAEPGNAEVRVAAVGWVSTTSSGKRGSRLLPVPPARLLSGRQPIPADSVQPVKIRGRAGVPDSDDVEAAVVSVTLVNTGTAAETTFLSLTRRPPSSPPKVQTLRGERGAVVSTLAIVPLDATGRLYVYNRAGTATTMVDVVGYTMRGGRSSTRQGRIVPLVKPFRAMNTNSTLGGDYPVGPGQADEWDYAPFVADLTYPDTGDSVGPVSGMLGTFTGFNHIRQYPANPPSTTELRVYPGGSLPTIGNLRLAEEQRLSNGVLARLSTADALWVYNRDGFTDYAYDVSAILLERSS